MQSVQLSLTTGGYLLMVLRAAAEMVLIEVLQLLQCHLHDCGQDNDTAAGK